MIRIPGRAFFAAAQHVRRHAFQDRHDNKNRVFGVAFGAH
jgi:hypothetical protein